MVVGAATEQALKLYAAIHKGITLPVSPQTKATSASEYALLLAEEFGIDLDDIATELPEWFLQAAYERLSETFEQEYWAGMNDTPKDQIEGALQAGVRDGLSTREVAKLIGEEAPERAGWRATNAARTETGNMLNAGHHAGIEQLQEDTGLKMGTEWLSVCGSTSREEHCALDGTTAPLDETFNVGGYEARWPGDESLPPEQRCNCFPAGALVLADAAGAYRAWYEGPLYQITTAGGRRITVTENHPVLAEHGWVRACEVQVGQQLWAASSEIKPDLAIAGEQVNHEPALIEQVFESLRQRSVVVLGPPAFELRDAHAADFYGDGEMLHGDVQVVRSDSKLWRPKREVAPAEIGRHDHFIRHDMGLAEHPCDGPALATLDRIDCAAAASPSIPEELSCDRFPVTVSPPGSLPITIAADSDAAFYKAAKQPRPGNIEVLGDPLKWLAGNVSLDHVIQVWAFNARVHVYDLQTTDGLILAKDDRKCNGYLVTSNCQCSVVSSFVGEELEPDDRPRPEPEDEGDEGDAG